MKDCAVIVGYLQCTNCRCIVGYQATSLVLVDKSIPNRMKISISVLEGNIVESTFLEAHAEKAYLRWLTKNGQIQYLNEWISCYTERIEKIL